MRASGIADGAAEPFGAIADLPALSPLRQAVVAVRPGPILSIQARTLEGLANGDLYAAAGLVEEVSTAINTAAAGGDASLMSVG